MPAPEKNPPNQIASVKTCIIFNPTARGEKARHFHGFLENIGDQAVCRPTWAPGAATELAKTAVEEGFENIVAAGGDGTLNEVLNGIGEATDGFQKTRLGILPLGTVNVFAKELNIPEQADAAWSTILAGHERTIDLPYADFQLDGSPHRRYFAQLAGAGLDAEAIALVDWQSKRRFGPLAYVIAGIRAMLRPIPLIEVSHDGQSDSGELVLIGNGRFYGGRLPFFANASLDDGKLDVCVFPKAGFLTAIYIGFWHCLGRFRLPSDVRCFQTNQLTLASKTKVQFELEGDLIGALPATIGLRPRILRVICPKPSSSAN